MSWKRDIAEGLVCAASKLVRSSSQPSAPKRIFVLRNNDLGDVLVITPLFQALKARFPSAEIVAGVGPWSRPILQNNPHVDTIFPVTAPWHNKMIPEQSDIRRLQYCLFSKEVAALRARPCDIGIDILGSPYGSLMMMCAGIPYRMGVKGYAGGQSACQKWVESDSNRYVGRHALVFAELLGLPEKDLPSNKAQVYLSPLEVLRARDMWGRTGDATRLVVGFGGGFPEKCWPISHFRRLLEILEAGGDYRIKLVGGPADADAGKSLASSLSCVENLAGKVSLRETFALTARAHQVMTNPSMLMHVAAAFSVPTVVAMGPFFPSVAEHNALWIDSPTTTVLGVDSSDVPGEVVSPYQVLDRLVVCGFNSTSSHA